jgi:hypothetical protein
MDIRKIITWPIAIVLTVFAACATALIVWGPPAARDPLLAALGGAVAYATWHMRGPWSDGGSSSGGGAGLGMPAMLLACALGTGSMQGCGASSYDRHTIAVQGMQLTSQIAKDVVASKFVESLVDGEMPDEVGASLRTFDAAIAAYAVGVERYVDGQIGSDDILPLALAAYTALQELVDLLRAAGVDVSGIPLFGAVR